MGRIDSTEELKPHEIALRKLCIEKERYLLIMATLGLESTPLTRFKSLLDNSLVKQLEEASGHFTPDDFTKLPPIGLHAKKTSISGNWVKDGDHYRVSDDKGYTKKLNKAVQTIYPEVDANTQLIPITLLLPSSIKQDLYKLEGSPSKWDFTTVQNDDKQLKTKSAFGVEALANQAKLAFPLRLFLAFKFLGLADTQQSARNGSRIFLELIRSLNIVDHFDLLSTTELKAWNKRYKQKINLDVRLNTQRDKLNDLNHHYSSATQAQIEKKQKRRDEIEAKISEIRKLINQINLDPIPSEGIETANSFYYAIPDDLRDLLQLPEDERVYTFPTLKTKAEPELKYTTICLGQAKQKDRNALTRDTEKMRLMLCYLCSMTSGTAITFYVDKNAYKGNRKTLGITSPTLILPDLWCELAMGLKQHNSNQDVASMSDENYDASNERKNFVSAIHGTYLAKQDELLRLIPMGDSDYPDGSF